jgi:hypothetical protein
MNTNISERMGKALVQEDTRELNTLKAKDTTTSLEKSMFTTNQVYYNNLNKQHET